MRVKRRKSKTLLITGNNLGKVYRTKSNWKPPGYYQRRTVIIFTAVILSLVALTAGIWGIAMVATDIMRPNVEEEELPTALDDLNEAAYSFADPDAMDVLAIKVSDDLKKPEYCMLMRFEPSEERVYITDIRTDLMLGERTLAGWFTEYGVEEMATHLAEYIDCDRVFTVRFTYTQTRLLLNDFGGVEITVPYAISYQSPNNDRNLNVAAGTRLYTGGETARLLNYPNWKGGEAEHRKMYCHVVGAFVSQLLSPKRSEGFINEDYLKLLSGTECDIGRTDINAKSAGLTYLAHSNTGALTMFVDVEKNDNGGASGYTEEGFALLQAVFGRRDEIEKED